MACPEVMNYASSTGELAVLTSGGGGGGGGGTSRAGMDWYAWLSRAGLEPAMAYEYALLFAHNELDEDDVAHLDHGFLLSMGVSVGKHRLQILHLAQRDQQQQQQRRRGGRGQAPPRPVVRLLAAAGRARSCLARCLRSLAAGGRGYSTTPASTTAALVAAQRDLYLRGGAGAQCGYWRSAVLKREKKLALLKQGRLTLTDGGMIRVTAAAAPPPVFSPSSRSAQSLRSPMAYGQLPGAVSEDDDKFWAGVAGGGVAEPEEPRSWDSMFQNLKPT